MLKLSIADRVASVSAVDGTSIATAEHPDLLGDGLSTGIPVGRTHDVTHFFLMGSADACRSSSVGRGC